MIRLSYPLFEEALSLEEGLINVIVIERPKYFREFVCAVQKSFQAMSSDLVISKDYDEVSFSKVIYPVFSLVGIDCNNKKITNKIQGDFKELAYSEDFYQRTYQLRNMMMAYVAELIQSYSLNLSYKEFDIENLFKSINLSINEQEGLLSILCDFIDIIVELFHINIFMVFHLKEYLDPEELEILYQHCIYRKVSLVLIESYIREKIVNENITIIDMDGCQI